MSKHNDKYCCQKCCCDKHYKPYPIKENLLKGKTIKAVYMGKLTQQDDGQAVSWVDPATIHSWILTAASDPMHIIG